QRKRQTRRVVKAQRHALGHMLTPDEVANAFAAGTCAVRCPYGQPGDRLRVKEHAWMFCEKRPNGVTKLGSPKFHFVPLQTAPVLHCECYPDKPTVDIAHPLTGNEWGWRKKLGRFLPKWASRIKLEIDAVRIERLHDITESGAVAE